MDRQLHVHDWDDWQTYRTDRGQPPWIKVHRSLLRDMKWVELTDAERGQIVSIWLLAADRKGELPSSSRMIQKLCHLDSEPDIDRLIEVGFLEWRQRGVNVASTRPPRVDTETEKRREEEKIGARGVKISQPRFAKPTREELILYAKEKNFRHFDPDEFLDHYESNGWKVGRVGMKSWQHTASKWERNNAKRKTETRQRTHSAAETMHNTLRDIASEDAGQVDSEPVRKTAGTVWPQVVVSLPNRRVDQDRD